MLNRAALVVRYKQPFVDWINSADPSPGRKLTLAEVNEERTVYLVEVESEAELNDWLRANHAVLFEEELEGWFTDSDLWPPGRTLDVLTQWCSFELHTVVIDAGDSPITDEDENL